ncbi:copper homeostasis protein CutC [Stakelama pacifica]|uniref:PF03932 family protein CutC n=1 Tax=Stakelama pacifica TaxID=517720 RepID=A0A4V3BSU9_9SPHN|nr:copper homeostasis protein CutC [Stakelama pacifica]TDN80308.1 copper homeostasis protein [Stakelama pacifica]GGO97939.1 copper homeostasis protein CutC [Stakelama pacifica]
MLEVCVDDAAGIDAALSGGADRLELASALALGGLTPPESLVRYATRQPIAVHLLARPRDGGFRYGAADAALVADDIRLAAEAGLAGVVIGASGEDRTLDEGLLSQWVAHARALGEARGAPLSLTLHRAFDLCPDLDAALDSAIALGFDRILTSGGAPRAPDALPVLARLHQRAGGRIILLAGSGVDPSNAEAILATGVRELHSSCSTAAAMHDDTSPEVRFGFEPAGKKRTDARKVAEMRQIISQVRYNLNHTNT